MVVWRTKRRKNKRHTDWDYRIISLEMPIKTDNIYNIDKKFDYFTIKAMVIESLQKILLSAKQEQEEQGSSNKQSLLTTKH